MLLQACKIWGVYIRQEIVKYLSGPFISRENTCTLHNLTTATYIYVNTNKVEGYMGANEYWNSFLVVKCMHSIFAFFIS